MSRVVWPVDEVLVNNVVNGQVLKYKPNPTDAREIIRRMALKGYTDSWIAYRIGYAVRSVIRVRSKNGYAAGFPVNGNSHTCIRPPERKK